LGVGGISLLLYSAHQMLAAGMKKEYMALSEDEAERLGIAAENVARHYDFGMTEKQADFVALFMALGVVYSPRILMIVSEKPKKQNTNAEAEKDFSANNVSNFMGVGTASATSSMVQ